MTKKISDSNLRGLGWELSADDGRWYWTGGNDGLASQVESNTSRISALESAGGDSFWVQESPGVIKYTGTAKATDVVATG